MKTYPTTFKENLAMIIRIVGIILITILVASIPWEVSI